MVCPVLKMARGCRKNTIAMLSFPKHLCRHIAFEICVQTCRLPVAFHPCVCVCVQQFEDLEDDMDNAYTPHAEGRLADDLPRVWATPGHTYAVTVTAAHPYVEMVTRQARPAVGGLETPQQSPTFQAHRD